MKAGLREGAGARTAFDDRARETKSEVLRWHVAAGGGLVATEERGREERVGDPPVAWRDTLEVLLRDVAHVTPAAEVLDAVGQVGQHAVKGLVAARGQADDAVPAGDVDLGPPVPADDHPTEVEALVAQHLADAEVDALAVGIGDALLDQLLELALCARSARRAAARGSGGSEAWGVASTARERAQFERTTAHENRQGRGDT